MSRSMNAVSRAPHCQSQWIEIGRAGLDLARLSRNPKSIFSIAGIRPEPAFTEDLGGGGRQPGRRALWAAGRGSRRPASPDGAGENGVQRFRRHLLEQPAAAEDGAPRLSIGLSIEGGHGLCFPMRSAGRGREICGAKRRLSSQRARLALQRTGSRRHGSLTGP